jgi:crotonobetainyl-CoA:carnitine CoA-transferase CaiB-like acyl-CoA transferase
MKLEGIRVLDLSRFLPGPHLAMMMADHGADVIKVEDPRSGDPARHIGPRKAGQTVYFRNANRGKRSLAIDLKRDAGSDAFLRLAETADVIVETFRPGVVDRLGVGYEVVRQRAPHIVYASISAFGQSGPYRDRPAHDLSVNALAGIASLATDREGMPTMPCLPPSDMGGSLMAFAGILMALLRRQTTGEGDYVDLSMFDAAMSWTAHITGKVFAEGRAPDPRSERTQGGAAFYRPYRTKDGRYITLGGSEIKFMTNFLEAIGRPDLIPLGHEPAGEPQAPLHAFLEETFAQRDQAEWVEWFAGRDICFAPVLDLKEAFDDPHLAARNMLVRDDDGTEHLGIPIKFQQEPGHINPHAPALGEHSAAILSELGYSDVECAALAGDGVIAQAD